MTDIPPTGPAADEFSGDGDLLAAELALGLLNEAETAVARDRLRHDAAFAYAHARWTAWAAGLTAELGEVPPAHIWPAIMARLPANDDIAQADTAQVNRALRSRLRLWQGGAIAASLAALVLGVAVMQQPASVSPGGPVVQLSAAPLVAVLQGKAGVVSVSYDPASGRIASAIDGLDAGRLPSGPRAVELWVIPADGKPRSLGLLPQGHPGWRPAPVAGAQALQAGVTLAVSLEPQGGSPTGAPTGPVVLTGKLAQAGA